MTNVSSLNFKGSICSSKERSGIRQSPLEKSHMIKDTNFMLSYLKTKFKKPITKVLKDELDNRFNTSGMLSECDINIPQKEKLSPMFPSQKDISPVLHIQSRPLTNSPHMDISKTSKIRDHSHISQKLSHPISPPVDTQFPAQADFTNFSFTNFQKGSTEQEKSEMIHSMERNREIMIGSKSYLPQF